MYRSIRLALLALVIVLAVAQAPGYAQSPAAALLQQSANAMGGLTALRALKIQVIESARKAVDFLFDAAAAGSDAANQRLSLYPHARSHPTPIAAAMGGAKLGEQSNCSLC